MIEVRNLWKAFGDNQVLKGLNLKVNKGETVVIIGRSGCGKSVLLKHIVGLLKPDKGSVFIDGEDITKVSYKRLYEIRKKIAVVFQWSALLDSLTVAENVGLWLMEHTNLPREKIMEIVREKLSMVELEGVENKLPAELSGGMKKRVAIARALALEPEYILYDEPTTALDPITARRIDKLIRELQQRLKITSIAVTHDLISASIIGDRIALLKDGKIVYEGTPEEIRRTNNKDVVEFVKGGGYV